MTTGQARPITDRWEPWQLMAMAFALALAGLIVPLAWLAARSLHPVT